MKCSCSCHSHSGFLTAAGYAAVAQQTSLEGLAPRGDLEYVDSRVSVSGLELERDLYAHVSDTEIDTQYRRFLNGS